MILISGILTYSGICTKTRAMSGKLLRREAYEHLAGCENVAAAIAYLKQFAGYQEVLQDFDERNSHRGLIETVLTASLFQDFNRLYHFARGAQRDFLDFYFKHYEVSFLKECLRCVQAGKEPPRAADRSRFFERHSGLHMQRILESRTLEELVDALEGSPFYLPLDAVRRMEKPSLYDYESSLDVYYFSYIWKQKDKILNGKERKIVTDCYGKRIDLLNIQWLLRARKNYRMTGPELYAMVIPCYYHLKPAEIAAVIEAPSYEAAREVILNGYYGRRFTENFQEIASVEKMYAEVTEQIYELASRREPYSIAPMNAFLYRKENEINHITSIIEGIRYGLPYKRLMQYATLK